MGLSYGRSWKGGDPWIPGWVGKGLTGASLCPPREEGKLRGPCSIAQQSLVFSVGSAAPKLLQTGPDGPRSGCSSVTELD